MPPRDPGAASPTSYAATEEGTAATHAGLHFSDPLVVETATPKGVVRVPKLVDESTGNRKTVHALLRDYLHDDENAAKARELFRIVDRDGDGMLTRWEFVSFVQLFPGYSLLKIRLNDLLALFDEMDAEKRNAVSNPELIAFLNRKARGNRPVSARRRRNRPASAASSLSSRARRLAEGFGTTGGMSAARASAYAEMAARADDSGRASASPQARRSPVASPAPRNYARPWSAPTSVQPDRAPPAPPANPFLMHPRQFRSVGMSPTPGRAVNLFEQNQVHDQLIHALPGGERILAWRERRKAEHLKECHVRAARVEEQKMNKKHEQVLCRHAVRSVFERRRVNTRALELRAGQRAHDESLADAMAERVPASIPNPPPPSQVRLKWGDDMITYELPPAAGAR